MKSGGLSYVNESHRQDDLAKNKRESIFETLQAC